MLVLEGRAAEHERSVPFGLLIDAERWTAQIEERAELTGTPGARARAAAARAGVLVARGEPAAGAALVAGAGELTGREREIAELVADGRSNKQVAAALFLSEKTIEHGLSRIYSKVGVRSRAELAARMPS